MHFKAIIRTVDGILPQTPAVVGVDLKDAIFIFFFIMVSLLLFPKLDNLNLYATVPKQFVFCVRVFCNKGLLRQSECIRVNLPFLIMGL